MAAALAKTTAARPAVCNPCFVIVAIVTAALGPVRKTKA